MFLPHEHKSALGGAKAATEDIIKCVKVPAPICPGDDNLTHFIEEFFECGVMPSISTDGFIVRAY